MGIWGSDGTFNVGPRSAIINRNRYQRPLFKRGGKGKGLSNPFGPERKKEIEGHRITEYYRDGKMVVYVDYRLVVETFEQACKRIKTQH